MKITSIIVFTIGMIILSSLYFLPFNIKEISSYNDIKNMKENQKVSFTGKVIQEYKTNRGLTIILDSKMKITCPCESHLNQRVRIRGVVQSYNDLNYIEFRNIKQIK